MYPVRKGYVTGAVVPRWYSLRTVSRDEVGADIRMAKPGDVAGGERLEPRIWTVLTWLLEGCTQAFLCPEDVADRSLRIGLR